MGQNIRDDGPKSHYSKAGTLLWRDYVYHPIVLVLGLSTRSYDYVFAAVLSTLGLELLDL